MCRHSLFGNREVSWLTKAACRDWSASGRRGAEADDARPREVDPAIIAKKLANNAGQPAAERVERRAGTEGNAGQQGTRRAQDRESVSQALERVRQAAKQKRKERFTALFHHLNPAMLRTAFFALKRDAAA